MKPWSPPLNAEACGEDALGEELAGTFFCSSDEGGACSSGFTLLGEVVS